MLAYGRLLCLSRLIGTVVGLLISDSPRREWIKLLALPLSVPYHIVFNTLTLLIGYYRDAFGFGEPTTFAPERTLLRSNLSRVAVAYRLRRALLLGRARSCTATCRWARSGSAGIETPLHAEWLRRVELRQVTVACVLAQSSGGPALAGARDLKLSENAA